MTSFRKASILSLLTLAIAFSSCAAFAQDHHDNAQYTRHDEWHKGARINQNDWNRGDQVDYRQAHLHAPPSGYEYRRVDGNYVMAAVATGVIASLIVASTVH